MLNELMLRVEMLEAVRCEQITPKEGGPFVGA
jgi:hypothetical protein